MTSPGIHEIANEAYHASDGVSRSTLWTLYTRTPAHARFAPRKEKREFDIGQAAHDAILQPAIFEAKAFRGPDDRRGNKWKNAQEHCEHNGLICLTAGDYDAVLRMRDAALAIPQVLDAVSAGIVERAAYAIDPDTGVLVKCKPDIVWNGMLIDIKTASNAGPREFAKAVSNYGYHVQELFYTDVWNLANGAAGGALDGLVDAFAFVVMEKEEPFAAAIYELDANAVDEGRAIYRKALGVYAACVELEATLDNAAYAWPAYPKAVQQITLPKWGFLETTPLEGE